METHLANSDVDRYSSKIVFVSAKADQSYSIAVIGRIVLIDEIPNPIQ